MTSSGHNRIKYKHSKKTKEKISLSRKGIKQTKETKKKISKNHKGMIGKSHSNKSKIKMSNTRKKLIKNGLFDEKYKNKLKDAWKKKKENPNFIPNRLGKKLPNITKKKMSNKAKLNPNHGMKGKKHTKKTKIKISDIKTKTGIGNYRKRALKNLNHICNKCNVDNIKILIVHHIDRNRYNNDLDNLEILCRNCHFLEHVDEWRKSRK